MGNRTTHFLAFCGRVVVVLMLQCLHMGTAAALEHKNYHTVSAEYFKLKEPQRVAECPASPAGQEALKPGGVKIRLDHIHGACSPLRPSKSSSWKDTVSQIFERDHARLNTIISRSKNGVSYLTQSNPPIVTGMTFGRAEYLVTVGFGTPANNFTLIFDTSSDVTWVQCKPCSNCNAQINRMFDPEQSSSYKQLPCNSDPCTKLSMANSQNNPDTCNGLGCVYEFQHGGTSMSQGDYSQETLTLGSDSFQGFAFGCGRNNTQPLIGCDGFLGMGRTAGGLASQTWAKYGGQFSYCLPDMLSTTATGSLSVGQGSIPANASFTYLVSNSQFPSFYLVGLTGISVGGVRLPITPSALGPTILDTGTAFTRLNPYAYHALRNSFQSKVQGLPSTDPEPNSIVDLCYNLSKVNSVMIPGITLHFDNNADLELSSKAILFPVTADASVTCLAFVGIPEGLVSYNIIGNIQQQETQIGFDATAGKVSFGSSSCTT